MKKRSKQKPKPKRRHRNAILESIVRNGTWAGMDPAEMAIYVVYLIHGSDDLISWPGIDTLKKLTGLKESSIRKARRRLVKRGMMKSKHDGHPLHAPVVELIYPASKSPVTTTSESRLTTTLESPIAALDCRGITTPESYTTIPLNHYGGSVVGMVGAKPTPRLPAVSRGASPQERSQTEKDTRMLCKQFGMWPDKTEEVVSHVLAYAGHSGMYKVLGDWRTGIEADSSLTNPGAAAYYRIMTHFPAWLVQYENEIKTIEEKAIAEYQASQPDDESPETDDADESDETEAEETDDDE